MARETWCAIGLICAFSFVAPWADAQDLSDEQLEEFEQFVDDAIESFQSEEYVDAIGLFESARSLHDEPTLLYNIARSYQFLERCLEARKAYVSYLIRDDISNTDRKNAGLRIQELESCVELGELVITCSPIQSSVKIDDLPAEDCPVRTRIGVGFHSVQVAADGYQVRHRAIAVEAGRTSKLVIELSSEEIGQSGGFSSLESRSLVRYGALGLGGALLIWAIVVDSSSVDRVQNLKTLRGYVERGNLDHASYGSELRAIEEEADAASTRAGVLYVSSAILLAAGTALFWVEWPFENETIGLSPRGIQVQTRF
jgi:hypothetical protein